jgi:hypothetical protein
MWLVGIIVLIAATMLATYALTLPRSAKTVVVPWDLGVTAQRFIFIVGTLSGFTVASAFFVAGFFERSRSDALDTVIGMLLLAFMNLVGTAMVFGTVPLPPAAQKKNQNSIRWQATIYLIGDAGFYLGVGLAWFALPPFLLAIKMDLLALVFVWTTLFAVAGGALRLSEKLYVLTAHNASACAAIPFVGVGAAAFYRFVLVPAFPALWPSHHASLLIATTAFAIAAIGFLADTLLLAIGPHHRLAIKLSKPMALYAPLYCQAIVTNASLVWASVAAP